MAGFPAVLLCIFFSIFVAEIFCLPFENSFETVPTQKFSAFLPEDRNTRQRRAEGQSGGSGVPELLTTAIKDGAAATSTLESPTMIVGGFSIMMQPMPNGGDVAGQLMQMAPHYMSLLPGIGKR